MPSYAAWGETGSISSDWVTNCLIDTVILILTVLLAILSLFVTVSFNDCQFDLVILMTQQPFDKLSFRQIIFQPSSLSSGIFFSFDQKFFKVCAAIKIDCLAQSRNAA